MKAILNVLCVSKSGYHAWRKRPKAKRTRENEILEQQIKAAHQASRNTYGSPRITKKLEQTGIKASPLEWHGLCEK